ncbi:MAG TPA: NPCBM/NEW2 domain-containing protein [Bacteroidota bacterium]|jgi:alpha-galactosidase|nr:NPCBM/NEW2 domain-containing protein [Bacteroidota bacterium]
MKLLYSLTLLFLFSSLTYAQSLRLEELDLSAMECGWGTPEAAKSVDGNPLTIAGHKFEHGVGTHAVSSFLLNLHSKGKRFSAAVGVDQETGNAKASIAFYVLGDKKILWESGVMHITDSAKVIDLDIAGVEQLGLLVTGTDDGIDYDHADWCNAKLEFTGTVTAGDVIAKQSKASYILTPRPSDAPHINSAKIFGVRPGNPFLYTVAATGKRPMTFDADKLPAGLTLDAPTGRITGVLNQRGEYNVTLKARNASGEGQQRLRISVGDTICLTPPMGWNSWNCWACAVDDQKVRVSADAMVASGLADHGWTYINIDDCWETKPDAKEENLKGEARDGAGMINTNKKFPDMKALSEYVHNKGLKLGIYSGPGPKTCAGFTASYQYETQDARRYADWGIDYLKYDWCSYDGIAKDRSLPELKKPYSVMRTALDTVRRDIVYSLCQYGMGNVWEWGAEVGGNCWRTTGDITDTWASMSAIGFKQTGHELYAGRGHWNDPDMLVVGLVGWGPQLHPTHLTPDEQYTHISLWSLLSAPLLIGCDLSKLDEFTLNLLTNDEVIAINQDPLGRQAHRVLNNDGTQIWAKELEDGSLAVGLFFVDDRERTTPSDYFNWEMKDKATMTLHASDLGFRGKFKVRDVWRQKDIGVFEGQYQADIPYHGVKLLLVTEEK